jgi:hypothetical protein
MKRLLGVTLAAALVATALNAGGPVAIEEEGAPVVEEEAASSGGWIVPALLLAVIGLAIASGDNESSGATW